MVVDHSNGRLLEVADGRRGIDAEHPVAHIRGRENVRFVTLDLCDPYKRFAKEFFPNVQLVADKFHVLRLPQPALMRYRKLAEDCRNSPYLRQLLLKPRRLVPRKWRQPLFEWLCRHPSLFRPSPSSNPALNPASLAQRNPRLLALPPHQCPHRGLQQQGPARETARLRLCLLRTLPTTTT